MLKHIKKHFKKRHHKKSKQEISKNTKEEPVSSFVVFGLTVFGFSLLLIPIFLGIWILADFEIRYSNQFFPKIFVAGESVGGKTYAEAFTYFKEKAKNIEEEGLSVNFENLQEINKTINIPMSATGLTSDNSIEYFTLGDWEDDLKKAYKWGHNKNIFLSLTEQITLIFKKKNFNFSASLQEDAVDSLLEGEFYILLKKTEIAEFSFKNKNVYINKEQIGEDVNTEEVIFALKNKLSKFDTIPVYLKTHEDIPRVTEEDLKPFLNFAENFAKETNLVLQYQKRKWEIKGPKLVSWFTIKKDGKLGIDPVKLENYLLNTVAKAINNPPQNSRFEVKNGKLIEIMPGKSGNAVNIEKAIENIEKIIPEIEKTFTDIGNTLSAIAINALSVEASFNSKNGTIYLPIETIEVEPKVTKETIEKYNIKNLVGEVRTSFRGSSADREHNIKTGAAAISGMLIAPGEEFSTVAAIGPVTGKEGYLKELVIKENKTTKEYGGGLCQLATTLFRLALNAGLPITERQNHRFVIPYYDPPGLDATIYAPHPDFRFMNDTGNYLLLQARVENKEVILELYGQKDGRSSEISKAILSNKIPAPATKYVKSNEIPLGQTKCFETPKDGVTTNVLYTVNYADGTKKETNFRSVYQPWQKVCLVGAIL